MKHTRKRIISILAAAAVSVCSLPQNAPLTMLRPAVTAHAANKTYFDFEYSVSLDGSSTALAKYHGSDEIVEIPVAFEGLPVTAITIYAFKDCTQLTDITIPNSVTRFGDEVFRGCSALTKVNIPSGISIIPYGTFRDCQKLTQITLPKSVTVLDDFAFYGCTALESIQIPDHVEKIGNFTFKECEALSEVTLPDSTVEIGEYAFYGCSQLKEIILLKSIENIEDTAFEECPNLTIKGYAGSYAESYANEHDIPFESLGGAPAESVYQGLKYMAEDGEVMITGFTDDLPAVLEIPAEIDGMPVTGFAQFALAQCGKLKEVTLPDTVTAFGMQTFWGCENLEKVTLPSTLKGLYEAAFAQCTALKSVTIPEGCETIGNLVFAGCTSLSEVSIPESVVN
ncbi:MAG: leucine-rich repeat domain-containing protein, partial [Oscillospiraceae bacterium]|nr:leucine-rich repeat domain-containing protein [Oscillospiraceae bacterium]